jgi:hypothetical protein
MALGESLMPRYVPTAEVCRSRDTLRFPRTSRKKICFLRRIESKISFVGNTTLAATLSVTYFCLALYASSFRCNSLRSFGDDCAVVYMDHTIGPLCGNRPVGNDDCRYILQIAI